MVTYWHTSSFWKTALSRSRLYCVNWSHISSETDYTVLSPKTGPTLFWLLCELSIFLLINILDSIQNAASTHQLKHKWSELIAREEPMQTDIRITTHSVSILQLEKQNYYIWTEHAEVTAVCVSHNYSRYRIHVNVRKPSVTSSLFRKVL